jgi:hypothetical protein
MDDLREQHGEIICSISKEQLSNLIEPHLAKTLNYNSYSLMALSPIELLQHDRFDLAVKLCGARLSDAGCSFGWELYSRHIHAFSEGMYVEPEDQDKTSLDDFKKEFDDIRNDISLKGFDYKKSVVPVTESFRLLNGSHRVSSAILCSKNIVVVSLPLPVPCYDYKYFLDKGMKEADLEMAALEFLRCSKDCYVALVWPSAKGENDFLDGSFNRLVYKKELSLTSLGRHNLITQVYKGAKWLGGVENNFSGAWGKINECFDSNNKVRVYVFQSDSLPDVVKIKEKIRDYFGIGNSSVHITDTKVEAEELGKILLNKNSIDFMNYALPWKYNFIGQSIEEAKSYFLSHNIDTDSVVFDSGSVLSLYGLRDTNDIDILSIENIYSSPFDLHDEEISYHNKRKEDLIYDPENFFYFMGLKFLSLSQIRAMKKNRRTLKDLDDLVLIDNLKSKKGLNLKIDKNLFIYIKAKVRVLFRSNFKKILRRLGLFDFVKKIYGFVK